MCSEHSTANMPTRSKEVAKGGAASFNFLYRLKRILPSLLILRSCSRDCHSSRESSLKPSVKGLLKRTREVGA